MLTFRRTFVATVAVLAVLVAALGVVTISEGPKLSDSQVDTTGVVSRPDQQLRLFTNQNITPVTRRNVTISPAAPYDVTSSGQVVSVQFTEPLRYATRYTVKVGVASAADGHTSTLSYGFRTASPPIYFLRRAAASASGGTASSAGSGTAGGLDQIVKSSILSPDLEVVYSAPHITDFAVFAHAIAVVTVDAQGLSTLVFIGDHGQVQNIPLPGSGTMDLVRANPATGILGFRFTSSGPAVRRTYTNTLFTVDPNGTAVPTPVLGLGRTPLTVLDWWFVPDSSTLVTQNSDQSIESVDLSRIGANGVGAITPLGSYLELGQVAADARSVEVADIDGPLRLDLTTGATTRIRTATLDGAQPYGGTVIGLPKGQLQLDSVYDSGIGAFVQHLVYSNGGRARDLFRPLDPRGRILAFSVSPNSEYVAIETDPNVSTSTPDGYPVNGRPTDVTTDFVSITTGALVKSVAGFDINW